jgi:hypothetical protein
MVKKTKSLSEQPPDLENIIILIMYKTNNLMKLYHSTTRNRLLSILRVFGDYAGAREF